ncbi:hypothetical protein D3C75_1176970 [compost metagenome]
MPGLAVVVEGVDLQPAVVHGKTGGPDDRRHAGLGQVEFEDRVGDTVRLREGMARFRFFR